MCWLSCEDCSIEDALPSDAVVVRQKEKFIIDSIGVLYLTRSSDP